MSRKFNILSAVTAALLTSHLSVGQEPTANRGPERPVKEFGRLGGGYRDAKWGMSIVEVKKRLPGRMEYETKSPSIIKRLLLDLGKRRKAACYFDHNKLYQVVYQPLTVTGDDPIALGNEPQAAQAVLDGLAQKFGPGKDEKGYLDKEGNPLKIVTWNDGITKIEFRMRDHLKEVCYGKVCGYPNPKLMVIYTDIVVSTGLEQRQEDVRKRLEERKHQQETQDIQNGL